jgi:hypothetical protein
MISFLGSLRLVIHSPVLRKFRARAGKETVYTKALKIKGVVYNPASNTVTILLARRHKGPAQVTIAPGLVGADGTTSSTITLDVR